LSVASVPVASAPLAYASVPIIMPSSTLPVLEAKTHSVPSSAVTTSADGNTLSHEVRHQVFPEALKTLPVVGNPKLPTFTLQTPKGEKRWQQLYRGVYFDVPGPNVNGPYYLVTRGSRIGVLATW